MIQFTAEAVTIDAAGPDGEPRRTEAARGGGARRLASGREGEGYQDDKGESGPGSHAGDIEASRTPDKGVAPRPA